MAEGLEWGGAGLIRVGTIAYKSLNFGGGLRYGCDFFAPICIIRFRYPKNQEVAGKLAVSPHRKKG
jgi:hypothetical protein